MDQYPRRRRREGARLLPCLRLAGVPDVRRNARSVYRAAASSTTRSHKCRKVYPVAGVGQAWDHLEPAASPGLDGVSASSPKASPPGSTKASPPGSTNVHSSSIAQPANRARLVRLATASDQGEAAFRDSDLIGRVHEQTGAHLSDISERSPDAGVSIE